MERKPWHWKYDDHCWCHVCCRRPSVDPCDLFLFRNGSQEGSPAYLNWVIRALHLSSLRWMDAVFLKIFVAPNPEEPRMPRGGTPTDENALPCHFDKLSSPLGQGGTSGGF